MARDRSNRIRRRRFTLTLNNPTEAEYEKWNDVLADGNLAENAAKLTFFVFQTERGESETLHYQAYAEFKVGVDWNHVKKILGERIHIENSRGNAAANIRYCTKNEGRVTDGPLASGGQWGTPKRGGGTMMAAIRIQNGASFEEITAAHPELVMMHGKKVEAFIANSKPARNSKPKITILVGKTGCGKSQYCLSTFGTKAYWVAPPDGGRVWFGHYIGQDVVIFDDFHHGWFTLTKLLRIMDSTPLYVAPKGDQTSFTSKKLVFTCNVDPKDWYKGYKGQKEHKDALERRIQDFADIVDCEPIGTPRGRALIRTPRTETFRFNELDFSLEEDSSHYAGVGDQSRGNGFF